MSQVVLSNIDFDKIVPYGKFLSKLDATIELNNFNASLIFTKSKFHLLIRDGNSSYAILDVNGDVGGDVGTEVGIRINSDQLFKIVSSYPKEELTSMVLTLTFDEDNSEYEINMPQDYMKLNHAILNASQLKDDLELINDNHFDETTTIFKLSDYSTDVSKDLLRGLITSKEFLSKDETSNNAVAVYTDKIMAYSGYYMSVYNYPKISFKTEVDHILLYKKSLYLIEYLVTKKVPFDLIVGHDGEKAKIISDGIYIILNNSMSNFSLQTETELKGMTPKTHIASISANNLQQVSSFFSNFFTSKNRILSVEVSSNSLTFFLRNSSTSGSVNSHVERKVDSNVDLGSDKIYVVNFLQESFGEFVGSVPKDDNIDFFVEFDDEHPVLMLTYKNQQFFTVKLVK